MAGHPNAIACTQPSITKLTSPPTLLRERSRRPQLNAPSRGLTLKDRSSQGRYGGALLATLKEQGSDRTVSESSTDKAGSKYLGKTAVVVGAGPAGAVAAAYLAQRGFTVKVFEKRPDPGTTSPECHRSIFISLQPPTVDALKEAKIAVPSELGGYHKGLSRFYGSFNIDPKGVVVQGAKVKEFALLGERHEIAECTLRGVNETYPNQVTIHFDHICQGVSFEEQRVAFFDNQNKKAVTESFDLLVAADGAGSRVRERLEATDSEFKVETVDTIRTYKSIRSLTMPPANSPPSDVMETLKTGWVTFAKMKTKRYKGKGSPSRIVYYTNEQGGVHGLIAGVASEYENIKGEEDMWAEEALPAYFPPEWKQQIVQQIKESPLSYTAPIIRVSKLVGPKTVLLGDSGHSVTPALGLGCNMAIMDGKVLNKALLEGEGDVDAAVQAFNDLRYEEIQKSQELQLSIAGQGLKLSFWQIWWPVVGTIHISLYALGNKVLPNLFPAAVHFRFLRKRLSAQKAVSILKRDGFIYLRTPSTA